MKTYGMSPRVWLRACWMGIGWIMLMLIASPSGVSQAQTSPGTIAYVRSGGQMGDEIRLIEPDGSNDRSLWTVPVEDPSNVYDIVSLDWRPDATQLAFSSNHERTCSIYASDIYTLRPDGTGLRRVSNGPLCDELASLPQGEVTVTIRNFTSKFNTNFFVHVQGAPGIIGVVIPHNGVATVTFPAVADFGNVAQQVVVLQQAYRWYVGTVDVQAGQSVTPTPNPSPAFGDGILEFGAWGPTWRSDSTRIGYARSAGSCMSAYSVAANNTPLGALGEAVLTTDDIAPCSMAWGPTAVVANQVIFLAFPNLGMDGATFYRAQEGATASDSEKLFSLGSTVLLLWYDWAKDGESLLFVRTTKFGTISYVESNLFEYDLATGTITQLTELTDEFVRSFDTSPDGNYIVFERAAALNSPTSEVWIMERDGSNPRRLVENGRIPNWSSLTPTTPPPTPEKPKPLFVPALRR